MKIDLTIVFEEFYLNDTICKSVNATFISLVLKKDKSMKDLQLSLH